MKETLYPELEIISKRKEGMKVKDIMIFYNIRSRRTFYQILERNGRNHFVGNKKYEVDDEYFEVINTEDKAYWLGFLYADGYVRLNKGRSGELGLKLKNSEYYHLELFNKCLKSNYPIKTDIVSKVTKNNKEYTSLVCYLRICNTKLVKNLMNLGCVNAKTYKIKLPHLREDLMRHFIRGYFDGDGCIHKIKKSNNDYNISILSNDFFIESLRDYLSKEFESNKIYVREKGNIKCLSISNNNDCIKFKEFIYKDSIIYLQRKKNIFDILSQNI